MKAKAFSSKNITELKNQLQKIQNTDFEPSLAVVFLSPNQPIEEVINSFDKNVDIIGTTTAGEIIDNEIVESSITVMLLEINKNYYKIYSEQTQDGNTFEIAQNAAKFGKSMFANPAFIVLSAGLTVDGVSIVEGINDVLGKNVKLFGGLAGDDLKFEETKVFTKDKIINDGQVFLILDNDKIEVDGLAYSGWEPIGTTKTVTKSKNNVIYEIDYMPAKDVFTEYYDIDPNKPIGLELGMKYPLLLLRKDRPPVMRTAMLENPDKSIVFAGRIPEGSKVNLTVQPDILEVLNNTQKQFKIVKERFKEADAMFMFSCIARHIAFGPFIKDEISQLRELWNNPPLIGFFTYGEIGNSTDGLTDFHNETCTLALLKEKE